MTTEEKIKHNDNIRAKIKSSLMEKSVEELKEIQSKLMFNFESGSDVVMDIAQDVFAEKVSDIEATEFFNYLAFEL